MAVAQIPITARLRSNTDEDTKSDSLIVNENSYIDDSGFVRKRPGIKFLSLDNLDGDILTGLYWWQEKSKLIAIGYTTETSYLNSISRSSGIFSTSVTSIPDIQNTNKVYFASDGTYLYFTNGSGEIYYYNELLVLTITDTDAPIAKQIAWLDGYLLAITGTDNKVYFSEVNDPTTWTATDFFSASAEGDNVIAIRVINREIIVFGTRSLEVWANDGVSPFTRVAGGFYNIGCSTPDAIVETRQGLYWFDQYRRLVTFNGRSVEAVSLSLDKELQSLTNFSDCDGDVV